MSNTGNVSETSKMLRVNVWVDEYDIYLPLVNQSSMFNMPI